VFGAEGTGAGECNFDGHMWMSFLLIRCVWPCEAAFRLPKARSRGR
jgi:hypothetical protein